MKSEERLEVLLFVTDKVRVGEGRFFMGEAFTRYKLWRKVKGLPRTDLNVDGFGRMFPKGFRRRVLWKNGEVYRGIIGAKLLMCILLLVSCAHVDPSADLLFKYGRLRGQCQAYVDESDKLVCNNWTGELYWQREQLLQELEQQ